MKTFNKLYFLVAFGATVMALSSQAANIDWELANNTNNMVYFNTETYSTSAENTIKNNEIKKLAETASLIPLASKNAKANILDTNQTILFLLSKINPARGREVPATIYEFIPKSIGNKNIIVEITEKDNMLILQPQQSILGSLNPFVKSKLGHSLSNNVTQQDIKNSYLGLIPYSPGGITKK